jgi:hypothetical protein
MKRFAVAVLGAAGLALSTGAGTAGAVADDASGSAAEHINCIGSLADCGYSTAEMEAAALEAVVTLWTETEFRGTGVTIWGPTRPDGRVCTPTTSDIDQRGDFPPGSVLRLNVESVDDHPGAHCDWQLIGPDGGHSTWVEGDIRDLRNLGSGWRNRAVAIRFT